MFFCELKCLSDILLDILQIHACASTSFPKYLLLSDIYSKKTMHFYFFVFIFCGITASV